MTAFQSASGQFGKLFKDSEVIIKQGDLGDCLNVIQEGLVEVIKETERGEVRLALHGKGDYFGELAIFDHGIRTATVRARGEVRVLTIDKKNFLRRMYEDPSLAFHFMQNMSARISELSTEVSQLQLQLGGGAE